MVDIPETAVLREIGGRMVLVDPDGTMFLGEVGKYNCRLTFESNAERVDHFKHRLTEHGDTAKYLIVLLNVNDPNGGPLADLLMPGHNWQEYRDRGEIPFARGLALREFIQECLGVFDEDAAAKLRAMTTVAVVVVDFGVAEVFSA